MVGTGGGSGLTPAATPSADAALNQDTMTNDPDARLVDIADESWGVILAHRLNNSQSIVDYRPSLVSGLLIKRGTEGGPSATGGGAAASATVGGSNSAAEVPPVGPIVIGVNLVWLGAVSGSRPSNAAPPVVNTPISTVAAAFGDSHTPGSLLNAQSNNSASGSSTSAPSTPGSAAGGGSGTGETRTGMAWTAGPSARSTGEVLLREILGHYRGLGLLARVRGMKGTKGGGLPWHIAAAMRGVKGLDKCLWS